jgi:hypothetical protein
MRARLRLPHRSISARVAAASAVVAVLAGCASAPATRSAAAPAATTSVGSSAAEAAAAYASNTPPAAAQMVCSDEIRGEVADALNLTAVAAPASTWAEHTYTCTYTLPMGRLVLAVTVFPSTAAARGQLETMRGQLGARSLEPGLGQQAYSAPAGTVLAVKDNMVLRTDATGLPDDLDPTHERRLDLARVITAGVFSCWTGNS